MGFSFQSLGQSGLLQSLLGAAPAAAGRGGAFPAGGPSRNGFGALLQQAFGTADAPALAANGTLKSASGPSAANLVGDIDAALPPSFNFFNGLAADQGLIAAPYGLDEAYDPQSPQTDFLSAAIATPQTAFNTKVATALRTNTIKTVEQAVAQPIVTQPVAVASAAPATAQDAQPVLPTQVTPVAATGASIASSGTAPDIEEILEDSTLEDSAEDAVPAAAIFVPVSVDVPVETAALVPSATVISSGVAGPSKAAAPVEDAGGAAEGEAPAGVVTTNTPAAVSPQNRPTVRTARPSGDAETASAVLAPDKREDNRNAENPVAKAEHADKETGRRTLAETDAGAERKADPVITAERPGIPIKPDSPPALHAVSHKSADPALVTVAPASFASEVQASYTPERAVQERVHAAAASDQVSTAVARAARDGSTEIHVRLDPVELGRVEVRLHFQADGEVRAQVTTDNPQTFDLLRRDSQVLERALQDAGLKTDSGSLSFSLRQQDHQAGQQESARNHRNSNESGPITRAESPALAALESTQRGRRPTSLFDVLA